MKIGTPSGFPGNRSAATTNRPLQATPNRVVLCNPDLGLHRLAPTTVITGRSQADAHAAEQLFERAPLIGFDDGTVVSIGTYRAQQLLRAR